MKCLGEVYKALCEGIPQHEARLIIEKRTGASWSSIISNPEKPIDSRALELIDDDLRQRLKGKPLARIYGVRKFLDMDFMLSKETLEPRFDTEILIEKALCGDVPTRILDIGTGSGCILLSLLNKWKNSYGIGVDISLNAVKTAQKNAKMHSLDARSGFICGNWADAFCDNSFDLIVSNPPYIKRDIIKDLDEDVRKYDPKLALDGGTDGLDAYRSILVQIPKLLKIGGRVLFEIGYDQKTDLINLAHEYGVNVKSIACDIAGRNRVIEIYHGDKNNNYFIDS